MFYDRTVTPEGITVITEHMEGFRSLAMGVWIAAGSRDELPGEEGVSHFIEHMMFKGTPSLTAAGISEAFDRMGAEVNAFTSKEYTCYYSRVLDQHWKDSFGLLADMVVNSLMAEDAVRSEREVVLEEIARHEDQPDDQVHELFAKALWGDHPIARPVLGRRDTVGNFMPKDVFAYTARRYRTGDVVVAAAGNVDHEALVALVREKLTLPQGDRADRGERPATPETTFDIITKDTEQAHITWGTTGLRSNDPARFAVGCMDTILGGGMSSRLFQEIREKRGLAYAVFSYHGQYLDTGQYTVYAGTRPENAEQVVRLIQQEAAKFLDKGATDDELARAKESIKGQMVLGMESTSNRMVRLGKSEVTHGELLSLDELVERVDAVSHEDLLKVAGLTLGGPKVLAMVAPMERAKLESLIS